MPSRWSFLFVMASTCLVALALASFLLLESPRRRAQALARTEGHLLEKARALAHGLSSADLADPGLEARMRALAQAARARVTVLAADGAVRADSGGGEGEAREDPRERVEAQAALRDGAAVVRRPAAALGRELYFAAARIPGTEAVARLSWEVTQVEAELAGPEGHLWWIGGGLVLVAVGASFGLGRALTRSLRELTVAAGAVEAGDFEARVLPKGRDVIAHLGRTFNRMTERLRDFMSRAEGEAARLATVLESLQDGVIAIGAEERISFLNGAARALLGLPARDRLEGKRLYEAVRSPPLLGIVEDVARRRVQVTREVEWDVAPRRLVSVHAAPMPGEGPGLILVLRDMSRLRLLERMRTDFVSNVSHELRTPLAAIAASAGNLEDETTRLDPEAGPRFVAAIVRNATRLQAHLDDILELSRYESRPETAIMVTVDFAGVVRAAVDDLREKAEENGVAMETRLPGRAGVVGDARALRRIVDNLVVNALTYTPRGGRVEVCLETEDDHATLEVSDTGIGIPPGDLERIFERFYRVDKARSRSAGGTGLGLSIVRHAAQLHGGRVSVESELGKGSTFRVWIPAERSDAALAARQEESA